MNSVLLINKNDPFTTANTTSIDVILTDSWCNRIVSQFLSFVLVDVGLLNVTAVFLTNLDIYVIVVYRPSSNTDLQDEHFLSFISDFCIEREVILLRDFNLPSLN